jgi:uncharacterized protein YndB with AHSA1/START domain
VGIKDTVDAEARQKFSASPEEIFDAWLDPETIGQWMFGPNVRAEEVVKIENDPRVGGKFSFLVDRGGELLDHRGEYLEIERPRRLRFTWGLPQFGTDSSEITVKIRQRDHGSEATVIHEVEHGFENSAARAWSKMLAALDKHLARQAP